MSIVPASSIHCLTVIEPFTHSSSMKALGKAASLGTKHQRLGGWDGQGGRYSTSLEGLRPRNGYCSRSTTLPLIGRLASESQYTEASAIASGERSRPEGAV